MCRRNSRNEFAYYISRVRATILFGLEYYFMYTTTTIVVYDSGKCGRILLSCVDGVASGWLGERVLSEQDCRRPCRIVIKTISARNVLRFPFRLNIGKNRFPI